MVDALPGYNIINHSDSALSAVSGRKVLKFLNLTITMTVMKTKVMEMTLMEMKVMEMKG